MGAEIQQGIFFMNSIKAKQDAGMILLAEGYTWFDAESGKPQASIAIHLGDGHQIYSTCLIKNNKVSKEEIIGMLESLIKEIK